MLNRNKQINVPPDQSFPNIVIRPIMQDGQPFWIEDEIGQKFRCQYCKEYYYYFQNLTHPKICKQLSNSNDKNNKVPNRQNNIKGQIQIKPQKRVPVNQQQEEKPDIAKKQEMHVDRRQHQKQIEQLNQFEQAKVHLSRVVQIKKSRLQNKQPIIKKQEEFETVPCPFCRKQLKLDELDHADICPKAILCEHCKQKIAISLKHSHQRHCRKKHEKSLRLNQQIAEKIIRQARLQKHQQKPKLSLQNLKKEQEQKNPHFGSYDNLQRNRVDRQRRNPHEERPHRKVQQIRQIWKEEILNIPQQRRLNIGGSNRMRPNRAEVEPQYNQHELDMQSRIRALKKKGIPKNVLDRLQRVDYKPHSFQNQSECPINFQDFIQGEKLIKLHCSHIFHQQCLFPYFSDHTSCPVCKAEVQL